MKKWKNVTEYFSESARHYSGTYLEIDEVYDNTLEVSLFSSEDGPYEIYVSYGRMYGIVYVDSDKAHSKREEIKVILEKQYEIEKEPSGDFINRFAKEFDLCIPNNMFFDTKDVFGF